MSDSTLFGNNLSYTKLNYKLCWCWLLNAWRILQSVMFKRKNNEWSAVWHWHWPSSNEMPLILPSALQRYPKRIVQVELSGWWYPTLKSGGSLVYVHQHCHWVSWTALLYRTMSLWESNGSFDPLRPGHRQVHCVHPCQSYRLSHPALACLRLWPIRVTANIRNTLLILYYVLLSYIMNHFSKKWHLTLIESKYYILAAVHCSPFDCLNTNHCCLFVWINNKEIETIKNNKPHLSSLLSFILTEMKLLLWPT